ncbi:MAG: MlaD family protein, partial [Methylobacteriaceae bacterium]|nr:MlaD family protein [Methylobacteriaceae bacterium]
MHRKAGNTLMGLATLAILLAGFAAVYWVRSLSSTTRLTFEIVFEGAVPGLQTGSHVVFNGLQVGEVSRLYLDQRNPRNVIALVQVDSRIPLRSDTSAHIEYLGVTGAAQVALEGGDGLTESSPELSERGYYTITAHFNDTGNLMETAQSILSKADEVVSGVQNVLGEVRDDMAEGLAEAQARTRVLADSADSVDAFLKQVS